jgi:hypothetical protein
MSGGRCSPVASRSRVQLKATTPPNNTFDRPAGSHALAADGQRARSAQMQPEGVASLSIALGGGP